MREPGFAETNATWTGTNTAAEGKNLLRLSRRNTRDSQSASRHEI
jgi:hypothetical protein